MKLTVFTILLSLLAGSCQSVQTVQLCDWSLQREGSDKIIDAQVPCTVAGALYQAGELPADLFEADNYYKQDKAIFDSPWTFSTKFSAKPGKGEHFSLVFDGLDYYADIFLNGKQLASSDTTFGMFIKRSYDVTGIIKSNNDLKVTLRRAQSGDLNMGFVDWNPHPLDESMGIVRPVTLVCTGAVSVDDVYVVPVLNTETLDQADLCLKITVSNAENRTVDANLSVNIQDLGSFSVPVSLAGYEKKTVVLGPQEVAALHIQNPRIWWSRDLGTPELYSIEVEAQVNGTVSDKKADVFGIRKIESFLDENNYRHMVLNGKEILVKGAGWTDDIFLMDTPQSIEQQVRYVADMNMNLIRFENIWGKDDTVYDLCDSYGLLALVGWSCQWEWEAYCGLPETGRYGCINTPQTEYLAYEYFKNQVVRLRNHPSVIAWMTGSDCIPNPQLEAKYLEFYGENDYRPYICSAKNLKSSEGWSGTKMAGPYEYVAPDYWYFDTNAGGAFGWNTETGIGANMPQMESLRKFIPEESLWPLSEMWDKHCTVSSSAMNSLKVLKKTIDNVYGGYDDLEDFVRKAHAVDYDGTRAMFEAFRVRVPNTTGIVQWMLNSAWPSIYWQLYDWYGVPTAAYYGTKKACEPQQLIYDYSKKTVVAVNETLSDRNLVASVKIFDENSSLIDEQTKEFSISYRELVPVFDLSSYDGQAIFVALELSDQNGFVTDNFYCIPAKPNEYEWDKESWYDTPIKNYSDLSFAFAQKDTEVEMTVAQSDGLFAVTLSNKGDNISYLNILKAKNASGELVTPAFWSDNFFPLLPGQTKTVTCSVDAADVHFNLNK